jgi:hypothetical protein
VTTASNQPAERAAATPQTAEVANRGLAIPESARTVRLAGGFHLGFGGRIEDDDIEVDGEATLGTHLRLEIPLHNFFVLGPLVTFGAGRVPDSEANRDFYIDIDLLLRGRAAIQFGSGHHIDLGVALTVGAVIAIVKENFIDARETVFGWNIGVLAGAQLLFANSMGLLLEFGFVHHRLPSDDRTISQAVMNFGMVILFG